MSFAFEGKARGGMGATPSAKRPQGHSRSSGPQGPELRGCGGFALTFFRALGTNPLSCLRTKCPKISNNKNDPNKRKNMNKPKIKTSTRKLIKQFPRVIIIIGLTVQLFLTGCASVSHKENSIHTILEKENQVIEKLKAERSAENLRTLIEQNDELRKAEIHLLIALDEIQKSNEVVTKKIMKPNTKEDSNGKNEGARD